MSFNTPILLLTFTRLDTTIEVFDRIKKQKPKYLFWASDGPRPNRLDDVQKIELVKKHIWEQIDWDCEVKTLFREENIGCGLGVSTAITWFFSNVEQGIILEDDCVPLDDFFLFCEQMLIYYKDNPHVYEVCGTNLQSGKIRGDGSYYFSNYGGIWGWATWARAWKGYNISMLGFDQFVKDKRIKKIFKDVKQQHYWIKTLTDAKNVDTWDYQWLYTFWTNSGICIVPNKNLIENIGFGNGSTHTTNEPRWYKRLTKCSNQSILPIKHPSKMTISERADDFQFKSTIEFSYFDILKSYIKEKLQ